VIPDNGQFEPASDAKSPLAASLPRWAAWTFAILFAMNMLDYIDRWALSAVIPQIQAEFAIKDSPAGMLNMYFLISYSLISPLMGWYGDRVRRTWLLAGGVGLWSLATVGTGLVRNYQELCLARSLLGIGEATYGVLAPTILMDLYPREKRSRVLSGFYLAMPVGYALGVILGGRIAAATGNWRTAFFIVGAPGLLAAISALFLSEPIRGTSEGVDPERLRAHEQAGASREDYVDLMVNSSYTYVVFGLASYTFAFGGLAFWLPSYLERVKGWPKTKTVDLLGVTGLFAAIVGMWGGGWLADRLSKRNPKALFQVSGVSMLLAVPCILIGLSAQTTGLIITALFLAQALMFANTGPSNAVIANVVAPNMRATAYAVCCFAIHFLGDVWSPWLMGKVSDLCGQADTMASSFGRILRAIGAVPVEGRNLSAGMLVVVPAVLLGGVVLLAGTRHLPREMSLMLAKLKAAPRPPEKSVAVASHPTAKELHS
jgi:MFS family permease